MNAADWLTLALACAAGAVSPGPSLALVLRHASVSMRAGMGCALAHALGVGVYAALAASGLVLLLQGAAWLAQLIALLAGAWLLRLAWRLWHSPRNWGEVPGVGAGSAVREGLLMGLVNPKVALFFVAVFSAVLPAGARLAEQGGAVALAMGVDGLWYCLVTYLTQRTGFAGVLRKATREVNRLSAVIFAALAIYLWLGMLA